MTLKRPSWLLVAVIVAAVSFSALFTAYQWTQYRLFNLYGFDSGIFTQGMWLLSRFENPYVTLRGLNLFGDHASFILVLVAPFYRMWPDVRLLVLLQAIAMAVPAIVIYQLGVRWVSKHAGCVVALAYLLAPATQWAAAWEFHPEVLAAAFLSLAVLSADSNHTKRMALFLCLAGSCKEDVSFVIFGFGVLLWTLGKRREGFLVSSFSLLYFVFITQFVMRLINGGSGSIYFQRNYGIDGSGPIAILFGLPEVAWNMLSQALSSGGLFYLLLVFLPLLFVPLLGGRWMLPVVAPLCLNLASLVPYQHEISYHYMATSAPFLGIATLMGLRRLREWSVPIPLMVCVMLFVAASVSYSEGPWKSMRGPLTDNRGENVRDVVLSMIPPDAVVVADYSMNTHLANRKVIYEFPNPFRPSNWGSDDEPVSQRKLDAVQFVLIDRELLGEEDVALTNELKDLPEWETQYDNGAVLLLHRIRD